MDPLRFRNVVSAASRLSTLVVRNICSDAMLKLIGANCNSLHPIRSTVRHIDITDTSITNVGLPQLGKKIHILNSIGEYSVSDSFLWSLCVVSSMKKDTYPLFTLHTRKVSYTGMYNLVHTFPLVCSLTCWEPLIDFGYVAYLPHLKQVTLIRIRYSDAILSSISHYFENCKGAKNLERVCLELIVHEQYYPAVFIPEFDVSKIFPNCDKLRVFTIELKDSLQATPSVGYSSYPGLARAGLVARPCFQSLCQVQFGQMIQNSVVSVKKLTNIVLGSSFLVPSEAAVSDREAIKF